MAQLGQAVVAGLPAARKSDRPPDPAVDQERPYGNKAKRAAKTVTIPYNCNDQLPTSQANKVAPVQRKPKYGRPPVARLPRPSVHSMIADELG